MLTFLRIDYRFNTQVNCCSDDYAYFLHASTIALDFDLDYSNQALPEWHYSKNGKETPIGFIGTGIFSAPFLLVGSVISKIFNEDISSTILNYRHLFYSLSSVFYFFMTYLFCIKFLDLLKTKINKYFVLLILSGSGLSYFAFERFSMTHVYEAFTVAALIYLTLSFYLLRSQYTNLKAVLIPLFIVLSFVTRMSNFYVLLIPLLINKVVKRNALNIINTLHNNLFFYMSIAFSFFLYFQLSMTLYGELIFDPQKIYGTDLSPESIITSNNGIFALLANSLRSSIIVLFSLEFGVFWVTPIIFISLIVVLQKVEYFKRIDTYLFLVCIVQNIFIIHLWQTTASSYGFRYLFSLVPICLFYYFSFPKKNVFNVYLYAFSILGNLSVMFFETTEMTQLSLTAETNSFGKTIRYVEPEYVKGLFLSFFELNSFLIIFTTSFLGAIFFKSLTILIGYSELNSLLSKLNLPVENTDFQNYLSNIEKISFNKFVLIFFLFIYLSWLIVNTPEKKYNEK